MYSTITARSGYCALVARTGGWRSTARSWAATTPSTWPTTIAYVQAGAIVIGHVLGVVAAHDRAVERHPPALATRAQYPLLGVMVLYTVGGLLLLLEG